MELNHNLTTEEDYMFKLFTMRKIDPSPLLTSQLYDERSFYRVFSKDLGMASRSVLIESPFLTVKRARNLTPLLKKLKRSKVSVRINTREPRHHTPQLRREAWAAIDILQKTGARVYLCNDLRHRKFAVIDNTVLWEGSLNILSQSRSCEIMRRTISPELCKQMLNFTKANNKY